MAGSTRTNHRPFLARHRAFKHRPLVAHPPPSALPEVLKPGRTQLGIPDRVLNVFMAQIGLRRRVVARALKGYRVFAHDNGNREDRAIGRAQPVTPLITMWIYFDSLRLLRPTRFA